MSQARVLLLFIALLLAASAAQAQRQIEFADYQLPESGALAISVAKGLPDGGAFAELDARLEGALRRAANTAGFSGDRGVVLNLFGIGEFEQLIVIGTGVDPVDARLLEDVGGLVGQLGLLSAAPHLDLAWNIADIPAAGAHLAFGAELGQYTFRRYRSPAPDAPKLGQGSLRILGADPAASRKSWEDDWQHVASGVRFARDLVSEPANVIYPESFVERTREAFRGLDRVSIEVLDQAAMERLGMGSILAVGQGSARPPRLMLVRYRGAADDAEPLAFVGKGITFDTGGISIKGRDNLWRMKYDMSGAAVVTGAVLGLARRGAEVNAIAVAALAENMPSGSAGRPGDVIRTLSGKTYEVISTDAEGRMVLVDAITYVLQQDKPQVLVDIATLTGSQVTAVGDEYGGLFTRDESLATALQQAGMRSGEELWRLPLHPSYAKDLESPIADLRNGGSSGKAGAGVGAFFIGSWVPEGQAWAHLDIASMAWRDDAPLPTVPLGASGFGVRLIDRYVRELAQ
ncbi:leucyl aminopeptidase [Pseudomarimonas salicorniae]|uniref:Probable cytosol aminopeptidase n=1 Tax=Pseudomarimonas salicorniae TaxID=2933270 RepID=A0ABT0GJM5_9GAMM|nr:leucyl aminopeptidase [Lysobacter sp. CAU 1642]MCK7594754.1 leucyl aminopeptidase [Lysobacter sp. CAU 1642]